MTVFNSCFLLVPYEPSKEEKEDVFKTVKWDKQILTDFSKYDSLAQILLSNLDTIINYKNKTTYVTIIEGGGKETKKLANETCYAFFDGNDYYDIKKIPPYLSSKVDSLWILVGKPEIKICIEKRPANLSLRINFTERKNNVLECHFLYWRLTDFDNHDSFYLIKDTALSKDCIYRIGITTDNSGW